MKVKLLKRDTEDGRLPLVWRPALTFTLRQHLQHLVAERTVSQHSLQPRFLLLQSLKLPDGLEDCPALFRFPKAVGRLAHTKHPAHLIYIFSANHVYRSMVELLNVRILSVSRPFQHF